MTRESPSRGIRRPLTNDCDETSTSGAPALVIEIPFESRARLPIRADTHEDEVRLREWLRFALRRRESLTQALSRYLDQLDEREAA